ncbi:MAG: hypothetical protein AB7E32_03115 [Desulfovibrio sp.]
MLHELSFDYNINISDLVSVIAVFLTTWIAWQTHLLQRRQNSMLEKQTNYSVLEKRIFIYKQTMALCAHVAKQFDIRPDPALIESLENYIMNKNLFNATTADLIKNLVHLYYEREAMASRYKKFPDKSVYNLSSTEHIYRLEEMYTRFNMHEIIESFEDFI